MCVHCRSVPDERSIGECEDQVDPDLLLLAGTTADDDTLVIVQRQMHSCCDCSFRIAYNCRLDGLEGH